jgi:hypothetical protein
MTWRVFNLMGGSMTKRPYTVLIALSLIACNPTSVEPSGSASMGPKAARPPLALSPSDGIALISLPALDIEAMIARDRESVWGPPDSGDLRPIKTSEPREVSIDPMLKGTRESLPDDRTLVRLRIRSPDAKFIALVFSQFTMPPSGVMYLHTPDGREIRGPFTQGSENARGMLWHRKLPGDEVVIDIRVADDEVDEVNLDVSFVSHGHDALLFTEDSPCWPDCPESEWCWPDAACAVRNRFEDVPIPLESGVDVEELLRSVGQLELFNGLCNCTGTLVNNTYGDERMLFLSASHCFRVCMGRPPNPTFGELLDSTEIYWHYDTLSCRDYTVDNLEATGSGDAPTDYVAGPGASLLLEYRHGYDVRDLVLLQLVAPAPAIKSGLYFAGWDIGEGIFYPIVSFHHPYAQAKKMSIERDDVIPDPSHSELIQVDGWDFGKIQHGSSGASVFNESGHIVAGPLSGCPVGCPEPESPPFPTICFPDHWQRIRMATLASSWEGLKEFLDPRGYEHPELAVDSLDGMGGSFDIDTDGDTIGRFVDNCIYDANIGQGDCDGDGKGDVCDDDICVEFCGDGVTPRAGVIPVFYDGVTARWGGSTGGSITATYCAHGAAGEPAVDNEVQFRWCDCNGYVEDPMADPGTDDCSRNNCGRDSPTADYPNHFSHNRWHLTSYAKGPADTSGLPAWPSSCFISEEEDHRYFPSVSCSYDDAWSEWARDWDVGPGGWCTYHCAPWEASYEDPRDPFTGRTTSVLWMWDRELWWASTMVSRPAPPSKQRSTPSETYWGYLWMRPGDPASGGRDLTEANNYHKFWVPTEGRFPWRIPERLPEPFYMVATLAMPPSRLVDPTSHVARTLVHVDEPQMALSAIGPEQAPTAGKFAYPIGLAGPDAAIAGLEIQFMGGRSLEVRDFGYSIGDPAITFANSENDVQSSPVPNTVGFSAARFVRGVAGLQVDLEQRDEGIAVFGGWLASGQASGQLWIGRFGGLDQEGTPFYVWGGVPYSQPWPAPRSDASMVFDEEGERLLLFGGTLSDGSVASDIWALDLEGNEGWSLLDPDFLGLTNPSVVRYRDQVFVTGGRTGHGQVSTKISRFGTGELELEEIADLLDGPGMREDPSIGIGESGAGRVIVFGGRDLNGRGHNDLWEYDLATGNWSVRAGECTGTSCPVWGPQAFIHASDAGRRVGLYGTNEMGSNLFFIIEGYQDRWRGSHELSGPPPSMDCDGNGEVDPDSLRACRTGEQWYAEVSRLTCTEPGSGEMVCGAAEPPEMSVRASWSPAGWERVVDFGPGPDGYSYVLTTMTMVTLNTKDPSAFLSPIDRDRLVKPCHGWCHPVMDRSFGVEVREGWAFVGSMSGVHVFSLEKPWNPEEIGYLPVDGPVRNVVAFGKMLYLASGTSISVVDASDPASLELVDEIPLDERVLFVGVNEAGWKLVALTMRHLVVFDLGINPTAPMEADRIGVAGGAFDAMKVDGPWTYLAGLWPQSVFDDPELGLVRKGPHDLDAWVRGRVLRDEQAERVRWLHNRYEVWVARPPVHPDLPLDHTFGD